MPANHKSVHDLETHDNHVHNRREWVLERIGWCVAGAILLAAVLGLLGPGPLSHEQASSADGSIAMDYYSIERYESPAKLRIWVRAKEQRGDSVRLAISRNFTDRVTPETIVPNPVSVEASGKYVVYTFRVRDLAEDQPIVFRYKHDSYGSLDFAVGTTGHEPLQVSQFILP